ncbi:hypothetical protein RND71_007650 [Anisodus tanguticus]|uniref:Uncharacterized protein n=1 Tax=Anisodus tanguticus TaxID=243964 RepID=A0AAE1VPY3_9SOLA|nr:hypothetical protein RND71_007650 [Anisodus tanguticus]
MFIILISFLAYVINHIEPDYYAIMLIYHKASHVLDPDLRNHWSTGTNTKEWILLELDEPWLLSHIRIYNKSVLEWEISAGLRYKPETFPKVRSHCEAPRRDMMYPMNYTPCRYGRISCLRGSPIAIFFVQNAKAIVFYVLEAIVAEHMEALVPEVQALMQVLVSLCRFSYCDVSFLSSVLQLVKPTISYSLGKCSAHENLVNDDSCLNLESLCFDELFETIKDENQSTPREDGLCRAMSIFVLASVFPDLSFQRKVGLLQSSTLLYPVLILLLALVGNCKVLLLETLRGWGVIPYTMPQLSEMDISAPCDDRSEKHSDILLDIYCCSTEMNETNMDDNSVVNKKSQLKVVEVGRFLKEVEALLSKLNPTVERCFRIHHKLAKSLALVSAESFVYSRCLSLVAEKVPVSEGSEEGILLKTESISYFADFWKINLEGLAEMILVLQENHLWELASVILGSVLAVPQRFSLHSVIGNVCSAVKNFLHGAPSIAWRLHSDQ